MTLEAVVCPGDTRVISEVMRWPLVVEIDHAGPDGRLLPPLSRGVRVRAVIMRTQAPLSAVEYSEAWGPTAVRVLSPSIGSLTGLMAKLDLIARLNVRLCLPASREESYVPLQILSSLGVACGLFFDDGSVPWDSMDDLVHYALYTKVPHAPIEPFHYVASSYCYNAPIDYADVYYDNPLKFARIDSRLRVALSTRDAAEGHFVGTGAACLEDLTAERHRHETAWQAHFLQRTPCSSCQAWRICLGKFAGLEDTKATCEPVFTHFLEATEHHVSSHRTDGPQWPY